MMKQDVCRINLRDQTAAHSQARVSASASRAALPEVRRTASLLIPSLYTFQLSQLHSVPDFGADADDDVGGRAEAR
jgi:hypothetical protein